MSADCLIFDFFEGSGERAPRCFGNYCLNPLSHAVWCKLPASTIDAAGYVVHVINSWIDVRSCTVRLGILTTPPRLMCLTTNPTYPKVLNILHVRFHDRIQLYSSGKNKSSLLPVNSDVFQGTILGQFLLPFYLNERAISITFTAGKHADDVVF